MQMKEILIKLKIMKMDNYLNIKKIIIIIKNIKIIVNKLMILY